MPVGTNAWASAFNNKGAAAYAIVEQPLRGRHAHGAGDVDDDILFIAVSLSLQAFPDLIDSSCTRI